MKRIKSISISPLVDSTWVKSSKNLFFILHEAAGKESFLTALHKLDERLDVTVMKEMELLIHAENYEAFIERMLDYYDNASKYQLPAKINIVLEGPC